VVREAVLFYWAAASSYTIFGVSEFAARLPSALAALISVGAVGFVCWRLGLKKLGAISSLVLATSAIWIGFSRAATTDMLLASSLCVAILAGFLAAHDRTSRRARWGFLLLAAAGVGLAMLAKGLIGVALAVAILGIHGAITRRWVFRSAPEVLGAVVVFALVAGLWYLPVTLKHGSLFIDEFFINHHFKRYLTNKYNHPKPFYYYAVITFGGSVPWSFFLFPALARLRTLRPRESARDSLLCLAWVWAFVPIAFFSLSTSKLAGYILPAFPALAIILGLEAERLWSGEKTRLLRAAGVLNTLAIAIAMGVGVSYLRKKGFSMQGWEAVVFGVPLVLGLATMVAVLLGRARAAVWGHQPSGFGGRAGSGVPGAELGRHAER
jgi:4-amino-4-deoxy-L-arabinose transferase-like glycosyltransferase